MVQQKGGVGKSTLARIIAVEAAKGGSANEDRGPGYAVEHLRATGHRARSQWPVAADSSGGLDDLEPCVILANNLVRDDISPERKAFALCITSDSVREIAGARDYLAQTPYRGLEGEIPFRASFKAAMDKGKAITETSFPTLRKRADAMAQNIIDAVAAVADRRQSDG